jgi:hypothetical protein
MMDHFVRESIPEYDIMSFDKPNAYNPDIEEVPDLHFIFTLKEALICFASSN